MRVFNLWLFLIMEAGIGFLLLTSLYQTYRKRAGTPSLTKDGAKSRGWSAKGYGVTSMISVLVTSGTTYLAEAKVLISLLTLGVLAYLFWLNPWFREEFKKRWIKWEGRWDKL